MASLSLRHIYKIYQGNVKAVSDFNLEIDDKEFIVFVGPSGCGKSTTLRMVAGLEEISAGELYIDGKLVNDVEPKDRDIAMVFQNYALYPHMTVYDNMAFGLRLRKMNSKEIDSRVQEAAAILGITPLLSRKPKALSGGQRQRVALGRAIVREPKVFLLDEPLSNLDAKLRVQMRTEITKLHNKLATTFIYVTHDQTEAMTMGTRIVVMKDGLVQQIDTPTSLYDNPENLFVASFLGSPQMNFFKAELVREEGNRLYCHFGENRILVPEARAKRIIDDCYIGKEIVLGVRPEDIHDEEVFIAASPESIIKAEIDVIEKLGNETILYMKVDGKEDYTVARIDARCTAQAGDNVKLAVDTNHIHFFDPETELTIMGVPRANRFGAKLLATPERLEVKFGNITIPVSAAMANKITDLEQINKEVILEIAPSDLVSLEDVLIKIDDTPAEQVESTDPEAIEAARVEAEQRAAAKQAAIASNIEIEDNLKTNSVVIEGIVDFVEKYPRFTAAYSVVEGKKGFMVSRHPIDSAVLPGDKIISYVDPEKIQLRDVETNEKLIAFKPVTTNSADALVTVKENMATIAFGKSKISMITNQFIREPGAIKINIDPRFVTVGKENVVKSPKTVIIGKILDADVLGANTIVYAEVEGMSQVFCAIVEGNVNYNINDKVKFVLNPLGITTGVKPSVAEIIADKAQYAPEYKYVPAEKMIVTPSIEDAPIKVAEVEEVKEKKVEEKKAEEKVVVAKKPAAPAPAAKKPAAPAKKPTPKK